MQNFDEILNKMTKPEINHLQHQEILEKLISGAKNKSVVSWWWLSIPLYLIAALAMKTAFKPGKPFSEYLHELAGNEGYASILFFMVIPVLFIIINLISIRKIYFLSGSPKIIPLLQTAWLNILGIIFSLTVLIIYTLSILFL
jgi:hypothetical protein